MRKFVLVMAATVAALALAQGAQVGSGSGGISPGSAASIGDLTVTGHTNARDAGVLGMVLYGDLSCGAARGQSIGCQTADAGFSAVRTNSTLHVSSNLFIDGGSKICLGSTSQAACPTFIIGGGSYTDPIDQSAYINAPAGIGLNGGTNVTTTYNFQYGTLGVGGDLMPGTGSAIYLASACNTRSTSTSYPQVCNQMAGHGRIAAGNGSGGFDIFNGIMTGPGGICHAQMENYPAGCTQITCAADAGNMTFKTNANCTGNGDFNWVVLNTH